MSFATQVLQKMLREARAEPPPPGDDTDVHLLVGGALPGAEPVVLRAHRLVLSTVSPVFHEWFVQADAELAGGSSADAAVQAASARSGSPRKPITIELADFPPAAIGLSLEVMYGGAFDLCKEWETAANCWDFAVRFRVAELEKFARKKTLQMMDLNNALHLLAYALNVDDEAAIDTVADFIAIPDHFLHVITSRDFLFAPGPVLDALTIRPGAGSTVPDSDCTVEKTWFDAVMRWLLVTKAELNGESGEPESRNGADERDQHPSLPAPGSAPGSAPGPAAGPVVVASGAEVGSTVSGTNQDDQGRSQPQNQQQRPAQSVSRKPPVCPRLRHVDHVLELVEFTRMKTEELAICAEEVTACHAARFPNLLIPLLVERTLVLEQERGDRERELKDLGSAFRAAVYAKNEAERNEVVTASRLEKVRSENDELRQTLDEAALRQSQHIAPQGALVPVSRSPSPPAIVQGLVPSSAPRSPVLDTGGGQLFDSDDEEEDVVEPPHVRSTSEETPAAHTQQRARQHRRRKRRDTAVVGHGVANETSMGGEDAYEDRDGGSAPHDQSTAGDNAAAGTGVRGSPVGAGGPGHPPQYLGRTVSEGVATQLAIGRLVDGQQQHRRKRPTANPAAVASGRTPYYGEPTGPVIPTPRGNYWGHPAPVPPHALLGGPPVGQYRPGGAMQGAGYANQGHGHYPGMGQRLNGNSRGAAGAGDPRERVRRAAEILGRYPELIGGRAHMAFQSNPEPHATDAAVPGSPTGVSRSSSHPSQHQSAGGSGRNIDRLPSDNSNGGSSSRVARAVAARGGSAGSGGDGYEDAPYGEGCDEEGDMYDEDGERYDEEGDGYGQGGDAHGNGGGVTGQGDVDGDVGVHGDRRGHVEREGYDVHDRHVRDRGSPIRSPSRQNVASPVPSRDSKSGSGRGHPSAVRSSDRGVVHSTNPSRSSSRSGTSKVPSRARRSPHGSQGVRSPPPVHTQY